MSKTPTRIYRVAGDRLIRATSQAQAIRHVSAGIPVRVATQDDLAELVGEGTKIETAGEQPAVVEPDAE